MTAKSPLVHVMESLLAGSSPDSSFPIAKGSPRDWVIAMLHEAAQFEHELMVQYLYAAYSNGSRRIVPGRTCRMTTTTVGS
jgi:hypothetical protein